MNRLPPEAIAELKDILARMPEDARRTHYTWEPEHPWRETLAQWRGQGLQARRNKTGTQAWVEFHGQPVPGSRFELQPDGAARCQPWTGEYETDPPPEDWTPPLELPGPSQNLEEFLEKNRTRRLKHSQWNLPELVAALIRRLLERENGEFTPEQIRLAAAGPGPIAPETDWIGLAVAMLDPRALTRLRQWTGQAVKRNLQNYNLAVKCPEMLAETARTNPGALAWWFAGRQQRKDAEERSRHLYNSDQEGPPPDWLTLPERASDIIGPVRKEFREAGGIRWKTLTAQPAAHVAEILKKQGPAAAVWISEALAQANLPEAEPPRPVMKKNALQQPMLEAAPPAEPTPRTRLQPPPAIKLYMAQLGRRTTAPGQELDQKRRYLVGLDPLLPQWPDRGQDEVQKGLRRMASLAFRHYAGQKPPNNKNELKELERSFRNIADYVFAEPQAAARATAWTGLVKASADWHSEAGLRVEREQLAKIARERPAIGGPWTENVYFYALELPSGFTARLLDSAQALLNEANALEHCVANVQYAQWCAQGHTRIFRLEPAGTPQNGPEAAMAQRAAATTVELVKFEGDERWEINQQTGWRNRPPTRREAQAAEELLKAWHQAEADASALNGKQPAE